MKKIVTLVAALCLVSSMAFAGGIGIVDGQYTADASSKDFAGAWNYTGDYAYAGGSGGASALNQNHGEGITLSFRGKTILQPTQAGIASASDCTKADAFVKDFGYTSIAGAKVKTEGSAVALGGTIALGGNKNTDTSLSAVAVGGQVQQRNGAFEIGYPGANFAMAKNESGGSFLAQDVDFNKGTNGAVSGEAIKGSIETGGFSKATVAPGHSAEGFTTNYVKTEVPCNTLVGGIVGGNGQVLVGADNGKASGTAYSGFGYVGQTEGSGEAYGKSIVTKGSSCGGGNCSSATSFGYSSAQSK